MAIPDATILASCQAAANLGSYVTVFTAAAGTTGANEGTGVTRQQTTWTAGTNTVVGSQVEVPCAAGTYVEAGTFSAATSGTFVGSAAFSGGNVVVSGSGASIKVTLTWS